MNRRLFVSAVPLVIGFLAWMAGPAFAVVNLDFDAAYMVAAQGSTEPVSVFDLHGPAPWLYLDMPAAASSAFIVAASSDWFHDSSLTKQFSLSNSDFSRQDQYWFSPSEEVWNATKAAGDWHLNAHHSLVELIIIYGGGVGRVFAEGSATVNFTVTSGMPGDFNNDAVVDAADYVAWRHASPSDSLPNDMSQGAIDESDYVDWKANVGHSSATGATQSASATAVPEPATLVLLAMAAVATVFAGPGRRAAVAGDC
jgi:hypothetical protein